MPPVESLALLRPTEAETDLLRACLWPGEPGRDAWERWQAAVGNVQNAIKDDVSGVKSLLPLLRHGLRHNQSVVDPTLQVVLNTSALAEALRYETYSRIAGQAYDALSAAAIPFLVLKGAALAVIAYPQPALRHSHDVDLLLHRHDLENATDALRRADVALHRRLDDGSVEMRDASGLPITLHDRLYRATYYAPPLIDIWSRAQPIEHAGRLPLSMSVEDHLVHECGHASCCRSRDSLKWVADAWYLIARNPSLDWQAVVKTTIESRLALPLAVLLGYLAEALGAGVPPLVLEQLAATGHATDRVAREVALSGVRAGRRGTFRGLLAATRTRRGRGEILRWMIVPAPTTLKRGQPLRYPRAWPAYYALRPLSYLARRARRLLRAD